MVDSILDDTKQVCGLQPDYDHYDLDLIIHINSVFAELNQIGVGPEDGFQISNNVPTWSDFIGDNKKFNNVRTYVVLKVKSIFDPPQTSFHINAMQAQLSELVWRISVTREETEWVDPTVPAET